MDSDHNRGQNEPETAKPSSSDDLNAYKSEVNAKLAMLASEIAALQAALQEQKFKNHIHASSEDETGRISRPDPTALADEKRKRKELMDVREAKFRQERPDRHWSLQASTKLQEVLDNDSTLRDAVQSIDCRSMTCRVEIADTQQINTSRSVHGLLLKVAGSLPQVTFNQIDDGNGGSTLVMYMSREATQPPPQE